MNRLLINYYNIYLNIDRSSEGISKEQIKIQMKWEILLSYTHSTFKYSYNKVNTLYDILKSTIIGTYFKYVGIL